MESLHAALSELKQHEQSIRNDGPVAPANCWIDIYSPSCRNIAYARLRTDSNFCPNGKRTMGLKRVGSQEHRDWQARIRRRNAIEEIAKRAQVIQSLLDTEPIWQPSTPH